MKPRTPTALQAELQTHYLDAPGAAAELGLDKSHLCLQLRRGKFAGAFQFGSKRMWIVPRIAVSAYAATHQEDADARRAPAKRVGPPRVYARPGRHAAKAPGRLPGAFVQPD